MGRHTGFITAGAVVASQDVNFALVPEVPFQTPKFSSRAQGTDGEQISRSDRCRRRRRPGPARRRSD
jgi:6-phosphofructokinase